MKQVARWRCTTCMWNELINIHAVQSVSLWSTHAKYFLCQAVLNMWWADFAGGHEASHTLGVRITRIRNIYYEYLFVCLASNLFPGGKLLRCWHECFSFTYLPRYGLKFHLSPEIRTAVPSWTLFEGIFEMKLALFQGGRLMIISRFVWVKTFQDDFCFFKWNCTFSYTQFDAKERGRKKV